MLKRKRLLSTIMAAAGFLLFAMEIVLMFHRGPDHPWLRPVDAGQLIFFCASQLLVLICSILLLKKDADYPSDTGKGVFQLFAFGSLFWLLFLPVIFRFELNPFFISIFTPFVLGFELMLIGSYGRLKFKKAVPEEKTA